MQIRDCVNRLLLFGLNNFGNAHNFLESSLTFIFLVKELGGYRVDVVGSGLRMCELRVYRQLSVIKLIFL
jgi:hypothetical protein